MPLGKVWPTAVTETSSTLTDLAASVNEVRVENGNTYRLVKAAGTIRAGGVCMIQAATQTETVDGKYGLLVVHTTGVNVDFAGVNDTGTELSSGDYFWMTTEGIVTDVQTDDAVTEDAILATAAGGEFSVAAATETACGKAFAADTGGDPYTCPLAYIRAQMPTI